LGLHLIPEIETIADMKKLLVIGILLLIAGHNLSFAADTEWYTLKQTSGPLTEFVKEVAQITGKSILFGPDLKGEVNLVGVVPMTKEQIWETFLSTLEANGYTTVAVGSVIKIIPSKDAAVSGIKVYKTERPIQNKDQFITATIELKYVTAEIAAAAVAPLVSEKGRVVPSPGGDRLIVVDTAVQVERIRKILRSLDVNKDQPVIQIVDVQNHDAAFLADLVTELWDKAGAARRSSNARSYKNRLIAVVEPRRNAVVLKGNLIDVITAQLLIRRMDGRGGPPISVVYLQNADAEQLAQILDSLISGSSSTAPATGSGKSHR